MGRHPHLREVRKSRSRHPEGAWHRELPTAHHAIRERSEDRAGRPDARLHLRLLGLPTPPRPLHTAQQNVPRRNAPHFDGGRHHGVDGRLPQAGTDLQHVSCHGLRRSRERRNDHAVRRRSRRQSRHPLHRKRQNLLLSAIGQQQLCES